MTGGAKMNTLTSIFFRNFENSGIQESNVSDGPTESGENGTLQTNTPEDQVTHSDELKEEGVSHTEDSSSSERILAFAETPEKEDNTSKVNYENYRNKTRERLYRKEAEDQYKIGPETPRLYWPATEKNSHDSMNEIIDEYNKEKETYQDDGNGSREKKIQELINRLEVKKGRHPMNEKQYAKVQEAIDLIKNNGNAHFRSYADNLQQMLKDGKIYMDEKPCKRRGREERNRSGDR